MAAKMIAPAVKMTQKATAAAITNALQASRHIVVYLPFDFIKGISARFHILPNILQLDSSPIITKLRRNFNNFLTNPAPPSGIKRKEYHIFA